MRKVFTIALIVYILIVLFLLLVSVAAKGNVKGQSIKVGANFPVDFMPDHILPTGSNCSWEMFGGRRVYCTNHSYEFAYNPNTRLIEYVSLSIQPREVGNFIVEFGEPTGYTRYGDSRFLYWGSSGVWVYGKGFTPRSKVYEIFIDSQPINSGAWKGFTND